MKQMNDVEAYHGRLREAMALSCGVWRDLMDARTDSKNMQLLSHEVLLSIQILGAALDIGICEICGSRADYTWRVIPRSACLMQRMIN